MNWKVAALYRFVDLDNLPALRADIRDFCLQNNICGTLLLAPEGLNGTVAGSDAAITALLNYLEPIAGLSQGEVKFSTAANKPFERMKVRLKKEIITMKAPEANPTKQVGTYVSAHEWNEIISDPDVVLLDTRNTYETEEGIFKGAVDPQIRIFTEFKTFVENNLDPARHKKIAMYCTGGIRCEKASAYMLAHGFETVYHLKGGILKYLEDIPAKDSLWEGNCYVFDKRGALGHGLSEEPLGPANSGIGVKA